MRSKILERTEQIRQCFSKASIVINRRGISAIYANKSCVTQTFADECNDARKVFRCLAEISDGIQISMPGNFVSLTFLMSGICDEDIVYPPLDNSDKPFDVHDPDHIKGLVEEYADYLNEDAMNFFLDIYYSDEDDARQKISDFLEEKSRHSVTNMSDIRKYREMEKRIRELHDSGFTVAKVYEPKWDYPGSVGIIFDAKGKSKSSFSGRSLVVLREIIGIAGSFDFDVSASKGFLNLSFYP